MQLVRHLLVEAEVEGVLEAALGATAQVEGAEQLHRRLTEDPGPQALREPPDLALHQQLEHRLAEDDRGRVLPLDPS